ncbi:tyrosine-type recombinase/integrase [Corynebacterium macclintockiae]|uniref:tyrosine-type recombinase/integrase n=1 Tax=Corynebacterium macclintockiae TaxID=2913501 RepID=UPI003EBF582D
MASIKKYATAKGHMWRVQYRSPDGKSRTKRGFATKAKAQAWADKNAAKIHTGEWQQPERSTVTINNLIDRLFRISEWKPSWRARLATTADTHVRPQWGHLTPQQITQSAVRDWLASLKVADYAQKDKNGQWTGAMKPMSGSSKRHCLTALAGALDLAVTDNIIRTNPARGFPLPKKAKSPQRFLTRDQVANLAKAVEHPTVVWVLATTGMRFGELAGLQVGDIDFKAKRIHIERNAVWVDGKSVVGTPKTEEQRTVTAPEFIFTMLRRHCAAKLPSAWVFSNGAEPMPRPYSSKHWFQRGVAQCVNDGVLPYRVTLHDLRHTAASLMVSSGANVKLVQRQLGHASAAMTLDTYAALFDDDLDGLRGRMDESFSGVVSLSSNF